MNAQIVTEQVKQALENQAKVWDFAYTLRVLVPNGGSTSAVLTISQDAAFKIEEMEGTLRGPVDANGLYVPGVGTDFPDPANANYATSGIMFKMVDQGTGKEMFNDLVFAETMLSPGYDTIRYQPQKWSFTFKKNSTIRFDLRNRDTKTGVGGAQLYHQFAITLKGNKYATIGD